MPWQTQGGSLDFMDSVQTLRASDKSMALALIGTNGAAQAASLVGVTLVRSTMIRIFTSHLSMPHSYLPSHNCHPRAMPV